MSENIFLTLLGCTAGVLYDITYTQAISTRQNRLDKTNRDEFSCFRCSQHSVLQAGNSHQASI